MKLPKRACKLAITPFHNIDIKVKQKSLLCLVFFVYDIITSTKGMRFEMKIILASESPRRRIIRNDGVKI